MIHLESHDSEGHEIPLCGRADWERLTMFNDTCTCWECLSIVGIDIDNRPQPVPNIDYEPAGCPICGGTTPPSEHAKCLKQLGEFPAKGERYNDDV